MRSCWATISGTLQVGKKLTSTMLADTAGVARAGLPVITLLEIARLPFSTPCATKAGTLTST